MELQHKIKRKNKSKKLTLKIDVQGKKVPITGTPAQMASFVKKLNSMKGKKQNATDVENIPAPEEVTEFIEKQEKFKHSMPILKNHFGYGNESYHQVYRMAKTSRERLEKKWNSTFREERIPPADGKRKAIRTITVWVFEGTTPL